MPLPISEDSCPFPLTPALIALINAEIERVGLPSTLGVTLTFRDPDYSPERGGYHPVEINIDRKGIILYVSDFAYVGRPPFAELAKEIDFDFSQQVFEHFGRVFPLHEGRELFQLWQSNFVAYYKGGVFVVQVGEG